jgi:hypothetical protein
MDSKTDGNQQRMEATTESEIKTIQENIDNRQENMKVQAGSLTSWIDANQEEMKATVSTILQKMKFWLEQTKACPEKREANPEGMKSIEEHQEVPRGCSENCQFTEEAVWEPASSRRAPSRAEKMDPGCSWFPEEVGCHPQTNDSPCHSCTAQGAQSSGIRQGQCCIRSL